MIGQFSDSLVVLGSATPSILDTYVANQNNRPVALLPEPARKVKKADIQVIPLTNRDLFTKHRFLSNRLLLNIEQALTDGKQALIFHNRRGSAPITICENCGWTADCPRCFLPLTLHTDVHKLRCHLCNYSGPVPPACPVCSEPNIIHKGLGTKLVVSELEGLFPNARIMRFDADSASHEQLHKNYQDLYDGKINLIVGTQMIAKGLDLPHLKAVGVIQADSGLTLPDYQSEERVFQLIYQVCGRVGRSEEDTNVVVQTYQPDHPSIRLGVTQDYDAFYDYALSQRKKGRFPPYSYLLKLTCVYATEQGAIRASKKLAEDLQLQFGDKVYLLGPAPSFYERMYDTYRWQIVVRAKSRALLLEIAASVPAQHWQVDLDPASLL
jgi:primosomal protein N' (replication factor Y)